MATPKFYLDSHLSKTICKQLRRKGVDIVHCAEIGMKDAPDNEHLGYATQLGRILVTCDKGINFQLHLAWQAEGKEHAGIVYFRMEDQCKSISIVVNELLFLHEAAVYETDLHNDIWWVQT